MNVRIFSEFNKELEEYWRTVEESSDCHVFQSYAWNYHWYNTVGQKQKLVLCIAAVLIGQNPAVIFPLCVQYVFGIRVLVFLGGKQADYTAPLVHGQFLPDTQLLEKAWGNTLALLPSLDIISLDKLPARFQVYDNPFVDLWKAVHYENAYGINLPDNFETYLGRLRTRLKADTRRQKRRLQEKGDLSFCMVEDVTAIRETVPVMIEQKRARYKQTKVPDALSSVQARDFYLDMPATDRGPMKIRYSLLRLNDKIIATHWGCSYRYFFYYLMPTYDLQYMTQSPGKILLEYLIEDAIINGCRVFDFTIGGEDYKKEWCDTEMQLYQHVKPVTLKGTVYTKYIRFIRYAKNKRQVWNLLRRLYRIFKH